MSEDKEPLADAIKTREAKRRQAIEAIEQEARENNLRLEPPTLPVGTLVAMMQEAGHEPSAVAKESVRLAHEAELRKRLAEIPGTEAYNAKVQGEVESVIQDAAALHAQNEADKKANPLAEPISFIAKPVEGLVNGSEIEADKTRSREEARAIARVADSTRQRIEQRVRDVRSAPRQEEPATHWWSRVNKVGVVLGIIASLATVVGLIVAIVFGLPVYLDYITPDPTPTP